MQPQVVNNNQKVEALPAHQAAKSAVDTLIANPAQLFSHEERAGFYSGQERKTLQNRMVDRVRDLQSANDNLQRQIARNEKEMATAADPLVVLAEIEHYKFMIARNTGEILNIHAQDALRLQRIRELEAQNLDLRQEMSDSQSKFILSHDMQERTNSASAFFLSKATLEKNLAEIEVLSQE